MKTPGERGSSCAAGSIKDFSFYLRAEGSHREDSGRGGSDLSLGEAALAASWRSQLGLGGERGDRETSHEAAVSPR